MYNQHGISTRSTIPITTSDRPLGLPGEAKISRTSGDLQALPFVTGRERKQIQRWPETGRVVLAAHAYAPLLFVNEAWIDSDGVDMDG
jgi:hypothetical protein